MMRSSPVGLPGLAALALGVLAFGIALAIARIGAEQEAGDAVRSRASVAGIAIQGVAIFLTAAGVQRVTLDPLGTTALVEAAIVALLMASAVGLFVWAKRTMGRNWSLVARTRCDHDLVQHGPFAHLRHPIYSALFLVLVAIAIALGHAPRLIWTIPLYALGTWLRIREEERLLAAMFGDAHLAYAARVKRFVPGLF